MYGKIFEQMFEGSMYGAGARVFAVWAYVIARMRPDRECGAQVELNARMVAATLGEPVEEVERVIEGLCEPDPNSRSQEQEGRRLIRMGQFSYQVVNGAKYMAIRSSEERREYNRQAKRKERALERIKEEEAVQEEVREKMNPGWREQLEGHKKIVKERKVKGSSKKVVGGAAELPPGY